MTAEHREQPPSRFRPLPSERRHGTALCLSGGGYRAALFHLGALTRLNETGVLGRVDTLSSVSGGSILAAHLVCALPGWIEPGTTLPDDEWRRLVLDPLDTFTTIDVRTPAIAHRLMTPWRSDGAVRGLAEQYEQHLIRRRLTDLPPRPRLILNATDMQFGVGWTFDSGDGHDPARCGDVPAGYTALPNWPLARAVAASSCFPPIFNPLQVGRELGPRLSGGSYESGRHETHARGGHSASPPEPRASGDVLRRELSLSDGGVFDNMGLEAVWQSHATVLVSDGGAVFGPSRDRGLISRLKRYQSISGHGGDSVRKRWLIANFETGQLSGSYWGIGSSHTDFPKHSLGYSEATVSDYIAPIRTDLDSFSEGERGALINHGYALATAATLSWLSDLTNPDAPDPSWPRPEWVDEKKVAQALKTSHQRRVLGVPV